MDPVTTILALLPEKYIGIGTTVVTVCATVAMALPAPTDTSAQWYRTTYGLINTLGLNRFHARNATAPTASTVTTTQGTTK